MLRVSSKKLMDARKNMGLSRNEVVFRLHDNYAIDRNSHTIRNWELSPNKIPVGCFLALLDLYEISMLDVVSNEASGDSND